MFLTCFPIAYSEDKSLKIIKPPEAGLAKGTDPGSGSRYAEPPKSGVTSVSFRRNNTRSGTVNDDR